MAIYSRVADYEALGAKLRLRSAVVVQPLSRPQVENYLQRVGEPLRALGIAPEEQPSLWEVIETPLMLWVALLAYRDVRGDFSGLGGAQTIAPREHGENFLGHLSMSLWLFVGRGAR
jgi:hypothetical protein